MRVGHERYNIDYIHHNVNGVSTNIRQIVFGMQDGMISTLGAITGIAIGSANPFFVMLAGVAIISVESISMGIGSYTSSRSEKKLMERVLNEEHEEIHKYPKEEAEELYELFVEDKWPPEFARKMVGEAVKDKSIMLREMAYRELKIIPSGMTYPIKNGFFMFFSYIIGGIIPLFAYFFFPIFVAIKISIVITLIGLFVLGVGISKFTKEKWYTTGSHMFVFGSIALLVGYIVGSTLKGLPI